MGGARGNPQPRTPRACRQPDRSRARDRCDGLALVDDPLRMGGADRRRRARGGGALQRLRARAVRRAEPGVRLGRSQAGVSAYDSIARIYDPWSVSVTEDVSFYVEEARRADGPVVELGIGTGRIAVPTAAEGISVIGV